MSPKPKKALLLLVKLSVSAGALYFVLSTADVGKIGRTLLRIDPLAFALAVLIYVSAQFVSSIRWKRLLGYDIGVTRLFWLYMLGTFFNMFLPGLVSGDAVKSYYLHRETGLGIRTLTSVFMDRYVGFVSLMLLGAGAYPFAFSYLGEWWTRWALPALILAFLVISLMVFGLGLGRNIKHLGEFHSHFRSYVSEPATVFYTLGLSVLVQAMSVCAVYVIAVGLENSVPFLALLAFVPVIVAISAVPVSVSGVGIREAVTMLLFGGIGIVPEAAATISFAWFLSTTVGGLLGIPEFLRHRREIRLEEG